MTAQLAVEMKNLPVWEVDWTDTIPQRDPAMMTIWDLLPSEADSVELGKQTTYNMILFDQIVIENNVRAKSSGG